MQRFQATVIAAAVAALVMGVATAASGSPMPAPFTRNLEAASPAMTGTDVVILQNLLRRAPGASSLHVTGSYDAATVAVVKTFQSGEAGRSSMLQV